MTKIKLTLLIIIASCFACTSNDKDPFQLFTELSVAQTGIDFSNDLHYETNLNIIEYLYYYNGGGVGIGDINNDGLEDIYFGANQTSDQLYLNEGGLKFKKITSNAAIGEDNTWTTGVTMDDVNGDGYLDIYVCKLGVGTDNRVHNLLYINNGNETFSEQALEYGLAFSGYSTQSTFFDYDKDGDLDMYLLNHSTHSVRSYGSIEKRKTKDELSGDLLFENRLNEDQGAFVDVTADAGIYSSALGYGLSVISSDINNDGWPDIYVGNDFHENDYLYLNNGDKTFTESVAETFPHTSQFSMGVDIADMNNDGNLDVFTTDMMPGDASIMLKSGGEDTEQVARVKKDFGFEDQFARNHFHLNNGDNTFSEIAYMTESYATDWSWSALLQDFDNDGLNDIFITNGIVKRPNDLDYINFINQAALENVDPEKKDEVFQSVIEKMPTLKISNVLFLNRGNDVEQKLEKVSIGQPSYSNGAAYGDLDNDGDVDIVVNNINSPASIFKNDASANTNYISFQLKGSITNPQIKGTKIEIYTRGMTQVKEYTSTRGFQSSSSHKLHFGLGNNNRIDSANVIWPDNAIQKLETIEINKHHVINRSEDLKKRRKFESINELEYSLQLLPFKHGENDYNDFDKEKLIPELLSREGPALVTGDFNGDGRTDFFIGGGVFQEAGLYVAQANGSFTPRVIQDFITDANYEDVDAIPFDFDNDGDLDLYVVSGGSDKKELDIYLQDRLYLNDGNANFKRHKISLPHTNGSVVTAGDYNKDGWVDLFVGARSIPGAYGLSPYSFILKNMEGQYFDLDIKERFGMITDAQWIDLNADDHLDLVLAGDWMPITVYMNTGSDDFQNQTGSLGLAESHGLWNSIAFADFNQDGHLDIIAGNAGQNFKWKASKDAPIKLYLSDYDKNEQVDPIIFHNYFGEYVPFASKDQIASTIPAINKKFQDYESFSKVRSIEDLTGNKEEELVEIKSLYETRSMLFIFDSGQYKAVPFPQGAQVSSMQDIYIDESNSENPKILFVGNQKGHSKNLGPTVSNGGGVLTGFDNASSTFSKLERLPFPFSASPRKIEALENNSYLISTNDGYQYLLTKNE